MKFKEIVIPFICSFIFSGCSSISSVEFQSRKKISDGEELVEIYRRMECLERYKIALQECKDFLSQERNPAIRDRQMIKCLSNKGFPDGVDNCQ